MTELEKFRLVSRLLGTAALCLQVYVYGPSIGLGLTQGMLFFCVWFNRDRTK